MEHNMSESEVYSQFTTNLPGFLFDPYYMEAVESDHGKIVEWAKVMERITGEFMKSRRLMEKLKSFGGDVALLSFLINNDMVNNILVEYVAKCKHQIDVGVSGKKNAAKASAIRLQGNQLFAKKEYLLAIKMYSRALMFVKDEDEEAAILYANRSACFFYLDQYENALEDIERAFKLGYEKLKPSGKVLIRKGFSLLSLGRNDQVQELLNANLPANDDGPDSAQWQQLKNQWENGNRQIIKRAITMSQFQDVSTVSAALASEGDFQPHERFPWLNAKVDLRFNALKYFGKCCFTDFHLVVKEEMKYGEIVALSKPFASLDPKRDSFERCHFCMVPCFESVKYFSEKPKPWDESKLSPNSVRMVTPLACSDCSNVLYCSEACRTKAWTSFHRFECKQMAILGKLDGKSHLALRMLYMMGTLDVESPTQKMLKEWNTIDDHLELMVDQEAYSFIFKNPVPTECTFERTLKAALTICFHIKLLQLSDMLPIPANILAQDFREEDAASILGENGYIHKAANACLILYRHLFQVEMNESMPFTDAITGNTFSPSPVLRVDGMNALMKHSCEATVASSSLLGKSLSSNVKILFATGNVPEGTRLTLAYDIQEHTSIPEGLYSRKGQLKTRYDLACTCTRCVLETRDCLDTDIGSYYPFGCSVCGLLMIRLGNSYRCSSTDGCSFMYTARQMKTISERVEKMMEAKRALFGWGNTILQSVAMNSTQALPSMIAKLKSAIESTATLLYGRSAFLANLYANLAQCYFVHLILTSDPNDPSVYGRNLPTSLVYIDKALDILEAMDKGPCVSSLPVGRVMDQVLPMLQFTVNYWSSQKDEPLAELPTLVHAKDRYEALLKKTAYDAMLTSFLSGKEGE